MAAQGTVGRGRRAQALLGEEFLNRLLRQLDAQHPVALGRQPGHIETLAAQWYQHPTARRQLQLRPVLLQRGIHLAAVKADLVARPARLPELLVH
ncbi:hypothetical protein D3C71_1851230 [compost metagenome]